MENWEKGEVDLAFFKFCYVDITLQTEVDRLFSSYEKVMKSLQERYSPRGFIHFTVPLRAMDNRLQSRFKRVLGYPETGLLDNIQRNRFNEKMRKQYKEEGNLFDLAEAEAIRSGGSPSVFHYRGKEYACLAREYTEDGGHLNEEAGKIIAEKLLIYLAGKMA